MKNNLRVVLSDKDNKIQSIWEVKGIGSRSRFFDKLIKELKLFNNGKLEITISKEK